MESPKLFISYSWSSPKHEQWIIDLSTQLRESGIDVILDKWELKEGDDAHAFMEKMVTDPNIEKVAIITDRVYAKKADNRDGGVGTETQIISPEIYKEQKQNKFVAIVTEKDDMGIPYVPAYYKSRIYIDLSEPDTYGYNFEKLIRWVFNEPLNVKPEIGKKPSFLARDKSISLGTSASFKRVIDAIKNNKIIAAGALDEYLEVFLENLERFSIEEIGEGEELDDVVMMNIESFLPYRDEFIQLLISISRYSPHDEYVSKIHRFFERLIPFMESRTNLTSGNFMFVVHELFLYSIGILLKYECFKQASTLLSQLYYIAEGSNYGHNSMVSFSIFRQPVRSLEVRNKRLDLKRLAIRADLLKDRNKNTGIDFRYLMQADFVLFIKAELEDDGKNVYTGWWPETLLYLSHYPGPFEMFARSVSREYFNRIKCLWEATSLESIRGLLDSYEKGEKHLPRWQFSSFSPYTLMNYEQLGKKP